MRNEYKNASWNIFFSSITALTGLYQVLTAKDRQCQNSTYACMNTYTLMHTHTSTHAWRHIKHGKIIRPVHTLHKSQSSIETVLVRR